MKRILFSLLAGIALLASPVAKADNITVDQAKDAAAHYMQHESELKDVTVNDFTLIGQKMNEALNIPSMYIFNVGDCGWIIMAASTAMDPLVGYGDNGNFDIDNMPPALEWWLNGYNEMICAVQNADAEQHFAPSKRWTDLSTHSLKGGPKARVILMQEKWDQGGYYTTRDYNMYSPVMNGKRCPAGCVAVALGQICHYYQFPEKGRGYKAYQPRSRSGVRYQIRYDDPDTAAFDYSLMPNTLTNTYGQIVASEAECREVSRLQYYIALAVEMDWGTDGSSVYGYINEGACMRTYFKYLSGQKRTRGNVSESAYMSTLRNDLMEGHPVYMSGRSDGGEGRDAAGHAWVCCGYKDDDENLYYMNWGWGGSSNNFYNLGGNDMPISSQGLNFTLQQSYIAGMYPDPSLSINDVETVKLGEAYPNPATMSVTIPYNTMDAADLNIYNAMGQLIESHRVQAGEGEYELSVDALSSGIYVYRMGNAHGKFIVR